MFKEIFIKEVSSEGHFEGTVYSNCLPEELRREFAEKEELKVNGEFSVHVEGKLLLVSLDSLTLSDDTRELKLNLDKLDYNEIYELEERLAEVGYKQNWISDYYSDMSDMFSDLDHWEDTYD